jgi:SAM-dependent methyltransferase
MRVSIDPEGTEIGVIHDLVDFSGKKVLEVGSGDGRLTWRYADRAASVLALEPNSEKIDRAIDGMPEPLRSKVHFRVGDIADAELAQQAFDVAILSHSLCCIEKEGVVHALRRIHRSLQPEGVLLDLHPQPEPAGVEVWQGGRVERLGHLDQEEDMIDIFEARDRLDLVEEDGWYVTERRRFFDLLSHFPSAEDWLEYQAREEYTGVASDELLASAIRLLSTRDGEFVVREPIRGSLLKRLPRPGSDNPSPGFGALPGE